MPPFFSGHDPYSQSPVSPVSPLMQIKPPTISKPIFFPPTPPIAPRVIVPYFPAHVVPTTISIPLLHNLEINGYGFWNLTTATSWRPPPPDFEISDPKAVVSTRVSCRQRSPSPTTPATGARRTPVSVLTRVRGKLMGTTISNGSTNYERPPPPLCPFMAPVFGLFASASSPAIQRIEETGGGMAASADAKPKGRRGGKPPPTKKQPQRGLGVEKLEQLRLQERWKMMHGAMDRHSPIPIYDLPAMTPSLPPPISPAQATPYFQPMVYLPWIAVGGGENAALSIVRPAMRKPQPVPEPPSSQIPHPCFSPRCEFCVRKKRLFGENPSMQHGCDYKEADLAGSMNAHMRNLVKEVELKEYDFFPRNPDAGLLEESEIVGADSSTAARCPSASIDLTLRLST